MDYSTDPAPGAVTHTVALELLDATGDPRAVGAVLRYDQSDPYAVTITFHQEPEVSWTFARDLLRTGIYTPTGDGDVHVRPCLDQDGHATVVMELYGPTGIAFVQGSTQELHPFVNSMTMAVRPGAESDHLDLDEALEAILVASGSE